MIDYYEWRANNPSVEFARKAARVLGLSVAELLGEEVQIKRARKTGPTGKVHKTFEEVSKLPRRQQKKIVEVVSALVSQYAQTRQWTLGFWLLLFATKALKTGRWEIPDGVERFAIVV